MKDLLKDPSLKYCGNILSSPQMIVCSCQRGSKRPEEDGLLRHRRGGGRPPEEPDEQLPPLHRQPAGDRLARQQGESHDSTGRKLRIDSASALML